LWDVVKLQLVKICLADRSLLDGPRTQCSNQRNGKPANRSQDRDRRSRSIGQRHVRQGMCREPEYQQKDAQKSHGKKEGDHTGYQANAGAEKDFPDKTHNSAENEGYVKIIP
ncbi:MAG: hypothetical protein WA738_17950, partial [Candidatus Angelobacter sp.]